MVISPASTASTQSRRRCREFSFIWGARARAREGPARGFSSSSLDASCFSAGLGSMHGTAWVVRPARGAFMREASRYCPTHNRSAMQYLTHVARGVGGVVRPMRAGYASGCLALSYRLFLLPLTHRTDSERPAPTSIHLFHAFKIPSSTTATLFSRFACSTYSVVPRFSACSCVCPFVLLSGHVRTTSFVLLRL